MQKINKTRCDQMCTYNPCVLGKEVRGSLGLLGAIVGSMKDSALRQSRKLKVLWPYRNYTYIYHTEAHKCCIYMNTHIRQPSK